MTKPTEESFVALLRRIREDVSAETQDLKASERRKRMEAAVGGNPLLASLLAKAAPPDPDTAMVHGRRPTPSGGNTEPAVRR
jgi:hypothetical protein